MFKSMQNLFKRPAQKVSAENSATADAVRKHAKVAFITPARQRGEKRVTFSAMDVSRGLDLHTTCALVCSAIDTKKFSDFARVELVKREGSKQGASAKWTFKIL